VVEVSAERYRWAQSIEEVQVWVDVPPGTRGKALHVVITTDSLLVQIPPQPAVINGPLWGKVKPKESIWSLEDGKLLSIALAKGNSHESWQALIKGEVEVDPFTKDQMDKKMMLEKFQKENPGFDFSGAEFTGQVPQDPKNFMKFD